MRWLCPPQRRPTRSRIRNCGPRDNRKRVPPKPDSGATVYDGDMTTEKNSELLRLLFPSGDQPTLFLRDGNSITLSSLLDQVTLDQAIELLKVARMANLEDQLEKIASRLTGLIQAIDEYGRH